MYGKSIWRSIFLLIPAVVFVVTLPRVAPWASEIPSKTENMLSGIGNPGPKAIELEIKTRKPYSNDNGKDERISVQLTPSAPAFVVVAYVSPEGDVTIVFPNKKIADNLLEPGRDYTIVSPECGIRLGFTPLASKGMIVVYVSSKPFDLNGLIAPEGQDFIKIPHDDIKALNELLTLIEAASKDESFSRKIITPDDLARIGEGFGLMGAPRGIQSSEPESVAGVQGARQEIKPTEKE